MNIEEVRAIALALPSATEDMPFGDEVLVFRIGGKIFGLMNVIEIDSINLKCDPERAIELREQYEHAIKAGYHMNKKHWNTVSLVDDLKPTLIKELIEHSYDLVLNSLPKKTRIELGEAR